MKRLIFVVTAIMFGPKFGAMWYTVYFILDDF